MTAPSNSPTDLNCDEGSQADTNDIHALAFPKGTSATDTNVSVPNWLLCVIIGLVGWSGWYLGEFSGGWSPMVYDETATPGSMSGELPPPPEVDLLALGETTYTRVCMACHQADGAGQRGLYPPLAGSRWLTGNPEVPIKIVLSGLQGPIEVAGNTYDGIMTPHGSLLDDNQVAGVLTWARGQWGNDASDVSPEFVAEVRAATAERTDPWTADELAPLLEANESDSDAGEESEETETPANEDPSAVG